MYVLLVDDHTIVLEGLQLLLSTFDFVHKTEKAHKKAILYQVLKDHPLPDIILLDIEFGKSDGREICTQIKQMHPQIKIIALTSHSDPYTVKSSIKAGFDGYLLKSDDRQTFQQALHSVIQDQPFFSPELKALFFEQSIRQHPVSLTPREEDVLRLIMDEKTTKEIADALFLSEKTIENHRSSLMQKMQVRNVAGLVKKTLSERLI